MNTEFKLEYSKTIEPIKQSKWFYLQSVLIAIVCFVIISDLIIGIWIFMFMVGLPILLQIILQLNFYLHDNNIKVEIDYGNRVLTYTKLTEKQEVPFEKITMLTRFQGSKYPKPFDYYTIPSNFYHYTVIETSDNKKIKFSDFVMKEFVIQDVKKKKIVIPFINLILE
jgi:hypothetical protein